MCLNRVGKGDNAGYQHLCLFHNFFWFLLPNCTSGWWGKELRNISHCFFQEFSLVYKKGDLFSCPTTDSLAHCVSKDLRMGKGIAVLFKQKFQGLSELHQQGMTWYNTIPVISNIEHRVPDKKDWWQSKSVSLSKTILTSTLCPQH